MKVAVGRAALIVLCVVICSGCTLFSPVKIETKKNVLTNIPLDLPNETIHPATLLVLVPEIEPIYATTQMAYTTRDRKSVV